jgi:putative transposase
MKGYQADADIADKAYDSDAIVAAAKRQRAEAVIPFKKNRKVPRDHVKHLHDKYKKVEWFISLLKQYRRVATG